MAVRVIDRGRIDRVPGDGQMCVPWGFPQSGPSQDPAQYIRHSTAGKRWSGPNSKTTQRRNQRGEQDGTLTPRLREKVTTGVRGLRCEVCQKRKKETRDCRWRRYRKAFFQTNKLSHFIIITINLTQSQNTQPHNYRYT